VKIPNLLSLSTLLGDNHFAFHWTAQSYFVNKFFRAYASLACDMTSASEVAVAAWGALQVLYAFAFALSLDARGSIRSASPSSSSLGRPS